MVFALCATLCAKGRHIPARRQPVAGLRGVALTPDGAHVVSSMDSVSVWSMTTGEKVALRTLAVSSDGWDAICNCEDSTVRVWTICTGEDGTIDGLRLKRVIGVPPTVSRAVDCRNADAVEPELARRILCAGRKSAHCSYLLLVFASFPRRTQCE